MCSSCPVCYDTYEVAPSRLEARILKCQHVVCIGCIESELFDDSYFCPECGTQHDGSNINEISESYTPSTSEQISDNTDIESFEDDNNSSKSDKSDKSDESTSFKPKSQRGPCLEPGCPKKALLNSGGFCLIHSKNVSSSITAVEKIVIDIADGNLNLVSLSGPNLLQTNENIQHKLMDSSPSELMNRFKSQERMALGEALELIDRARDIMMREPNILQLDAPVITVGDIHGQFYDLLNLLEEGGQPGPDNTYLFLGDYVDRGSFSCEVMLTLLKLKVTYPERIYLIRGSY